MIPDFKTYLRESVWSDIQKRSMRQQTRKEDDIDLLDKDGLIDYLKNHYTGKDNWLLTSDDMGGMISVMIFEDYFGYYSYLTYIDIEGDPEISILGGFDKVAKKLYNEIKSKYSTEIREYEDKDGHPCGDVLV